MNLLEATVVLRDRSLVDTFDLALRFAVVHAKRLVVLALVVIVPGFLVSWGIGEAAGWEWGWLVALSLGLLAEAPFTALIARLLFADDVRTRDALRESLRSLPSLIGARIVQVLVVGTAALLFIFPAIWAGAMVLFLPEILALERTDLSTSTKRAFRLSTGQTGEAIMATLLLLAAFIALPLLFDEAGRGLLQDLFEIMPPKPFTDTGGGFLPMLGFWCFVPFSAVVRFFVYINLRTRAEGWDIQTRFAALVARAQMEEGAT